MLNFAILKVNINSKKKEVNSSFKRGCNCSFILIGFLYFIFLFLFCNDSFSQKSQVIINLGWAELVKDNDVEAFRYFDEAYKTAQLEKDTENTALSLLYMGICSYSVSFTEGMNYSIKAMEEFKKFEKTSPQKALVGRSKCLQLVSTINSRQGNYRESIRLSKEAALGFPESNDSTGYLGLIYNSLGIAYANLNQPDSSAYSHRKALEERLLTRNFTYLPGSYTAVAKIEISSGNKLLSRQYLDRAIQIADSTQNRQALVTAYLGLSDWFQKFSNDKNEAEKIVLQANEIAMALTDRSFYLKTLEALIALKKESGDFQSALKLEEKGTIVRDSMYSWEKQKIQKSLEVQFDVSEKDRQLKLAQREREVARLTNYLLWAIIGFVLIIAVGIIFFLRRNNERNKLLLKTKDA